MNRYEAESIDLDLIAQDTERESLRRFELRAAKADVRQLQGALADAHRRIETLEAALRTWAPLLAQYEREMIDRAARRQLVESLEVWIGDLVRQVGGVVVDDGAGADWLRRR